MGKLMCVFLAIIAMGRFIDAATYVNNVCRCGVRTASYSYFILNYFTTSASIGYCGTYPTALGAGVVTLFGNSYVNNPFLYISGCQDYCASRSPNDPNCVTCCTCCCGESGLDFYGPNSNCVTATTTIATTPEVFTTPPTELTTSEYFTTPPPETTVPPVYTPRRTKTTKPPKTKTTRPPVYTTPRTKTTRPPKTKTTRPPVYTTPRTKTTTRAVYTNRTPRTTTRRVYTTRTRRNQYI